MPWWLPEETNEGQWSPLMKTVFQFGLNSKLSTGSERFVCLLHFRDITRVSLPAPTPSRYFKILQILKEPKVLTDISLFLLPQVSGSYFFLELLWHTNRGTCDMYKYSHLSNEQEILMPADSIFEWKVSLSIRKQETLLVGLNSAGTPQR